jgi:hypothetical protein
MTPTNGNRRARQWFRRGHRWVGLSAVVFVLFLAVSGVTLNHASDLGLDRHYVGWSWVLDAYGIQAPAPSASFEDGGHRGTLLGERLFLDGLDTGQRLSMLTGFVAVDQFVLATAEQGAHLFTSVGRSFRAMAGCSAAMRNSPASSPGKSARRQRSAGRFQHRRMPQNSRSLIPPGVAWRGRGLTVERMVLDLHSGRIFDMPGVLLMDLVALCMIVLGLSGLLLSNSRYRRQNGAKSANQD